jgi:hypothetical protein
MDLAAWAKSHKPQLAVGGIGGAAVLGLIAHRSRTKAAAKGATAGAANGAQGSYSGPVTGGDPYGLSQDITNGITPQLQALQQAITTLQQGASTPTNNAGDTWTPPAGYHDATNPKDTPGGLFGSGYYFPGTQTSRGGHRFGYLAPGVDLGAFPNNLWYEPTPGFFTRTKGHKLRPRTPIYARL